MAKCRTITTDEHRFAQYDFLLCQKFITINHFQFGYYLDYIQPTIGRRSIAAALFRYNHGIKYVEQ